MNLWYFKNLLLLLLLFVFVTKSKAQVSATGRVSAEVVESVGASAKVVTGFDIKNSTNEEYGTIAVSNLNLGTVTIHSGTNVAYSIVLQQASLVNELGNGLEIETAFSAGKKKEIQGTKTLNLKAKAWTRSGHDSGVYKGNYEMIFAYN